MFDLQKDSYLRADDSDLTGAFDLRHGKEVTQKTKQLSPLPHRLKETKGDVKRGTVSGSGVTTVNDTICPTAIKELIRYKG